MPRVCENAQGDTEGPKQGPLKHLATTMKRMAARDAGEVPHAALLLQLTSLHALAVRVGCGGSVGFGGSVGCGGSMWDGIGLWSTFCEWF